MPVKRARQLAGDYVSRYHDRDPLYAILVGEQSVPWDRPQLLDLQRATIRPIIFFDRNKLIDKTSTFDRVEQGSVLYNFYRMASSGRYSAQEHERRAHLAAGHRMHFCALSPGAWYAYSAAAGVACRSHPQSHPHDHRASGPPLGRLTARERAVCERIVLGSTSMGIGFDLHVTLSSVPTYRKRAYAKLGIGSREQLFALCLQASRQVR